MYSMLKLRPHPFCTLSFSNLLLSNPPLFGLVSSRCPPEVWIGANFRVDIPELPGWKLNSSSCCGNKVALRKVLMASAHLSHSRTPLSLVFSCFSSSRQRFRLFYRGTLPRHNSRHGVGSGTNYSLKWDYFLKWSRKRLPCCLFGSIHPNFVPPHIFVCSFQAKRRLLSPGERCQSDTLTSESDSHA